VKSVGWKVTYALVVDDLGDGGELALEGTSGEEDDAADLNEAPGGGCHAGGHCALEEGRACEVLEGRDVSEVSFARKM